PSGAEGFLAVEEDDLPGEFTIPCGEHARQLDQERGARTAVVGADERGVAHQLRVVVAGEEDALLATARQPDREVDHLDAADRRDGGERLLLDRQAGACELAGEVGARLAQREGAGRTRTEPDDLLEMRPGPAGVERTGRSEERRVGREWG